MADKKQSPDPEEHITPEAPAPDIFGPPPAPPDLTAEAAVTLEKEGEAALREMGESLPDPSEVFIPPSVEGVPFDGVDVADATKEAEPTTEDNRQEWEKPIAELEAEQQKPRRGRAPKADKAEAAVPRKGRPPKE